MKRIVLINSIVPLVLLFAFSLSIFVSPVYSEDKKTTIDQILDLCIERNISDIKKNEGKKITLMVEVYSVQYDSIYNLKEPHFTSGYCDPQKNKGCIFLRLILADNRASTLDDLKSGLLVLSTCNIRTISDKSRYAILDNCIIDKTILDVSRTKQ